MQPCSKLRNDLILINFMSTAILSNDFEEIHFIIFSTEHTVPLLNPIYILPPDLFDNDHETTSLF